MTDTIEREKNRIMMEVLLSSDEGNRFIERLVKKCGGSRGNLFFPNSNIYYEAGRRSIRDWVMEEILDVDPDAYVRLFRREKKT